MVNFEYQFALPRNTNFAAAPFTGVGPSDVTFTNLSPYAKSVNVLVKAALGGNQTDPYIFTLYPKELPFGTTADWEGYRINPIVCGGDANANGTVHQMWLEFPLFDSQTLTIAQVGMPAVTQSTRLYWLGFKE